MPFDSGPAWFLKQWISTLPERTEVKATNATWIFEFGGQQVRGIEDRPLLLR